MSNKAKFSHVMNDDMCGITFLYFDSGHVQDLAGDKDIDYPAEFCVHMDSQDVDKLNSALNNELNENTVFSPQEMELLKRIVERDIDYIKTFPGYTFPSSWTKEQWETFLEKLS